MGFGVQGLGRGRLGFSVFSCRMSTACVVERLGCWCFQDLRGFEGFRVLKGYVETSIKRHGAQGVGYRDEASWMRFRV